VALTISQGQPGDTFQTDSKKFIETEQTKFCEITDQVLPVFASDEAAIAKGWEKRLIPGVFTLSCSVGLMEKAGLLDDVLAFMALDKLRYLAPVYIGDSIYVKVELVEKKSIKEGSRNIINYKFTTYNQNDKPVLEAVNT
jgi:acyl dehydratase